MKQLLDSIPSRCPTSVNLFPRVPFRHIIGNRFGRIVRPTKIVCDIHHSLHPSSASPMCSHCRGGAISGDTQCNWRFNCFTVAKQPLYTLSTSCNLFCVRYTTPNSHITREATLRHDLQTASSAPCLLIAVHFCWGETGRHFPPHIWNDVTGSPRFGSDECCHGDRLLAPIPVTG